MIRQYLAPTTLSLMIPLYLIASKLKRSKPC